MEELGRPVRALKKSLRRAVQVSVLLDYNLSLTRTFTDALCRMMLDIALKTVEICVFAIMFVCECM